MIDINRAIFEVADKLKGPAGLFFRTMSVVVDDLHEEAGAPYGVIFVYPKKYEDFSCKPVTDKIIDAVYDAFKLQDSQATSRYIVVVESTDWVAEINEIRRQKGIDLLTANTHGTQH